jgi:hypothetical protein
MPPARAMVADHGFVFSMISGLKNRSELEEAFRRAEILVPLWFQ